MVGKVHAFLIIIVNLYIYLVQNPEWQESSCSINKRKNQRSHPDGRLRSLGLSLTLPELVFPFVLDSWATL